MYASDSCIGNLPRFPYSDGINKPIHIAAMWFLYDALEKGSNKPDKNHEVTSPYAHHINKTPP